MRLHSRAGKIEVNPVTTALTVTSNPPGTPGSIPTSIEGIPLEIQHINATTTRGNFQFNPTNCNKMEVTGTIHSSEGGTDSIGVPFQVTNCQALKFTPKFAVSTSGKTSKADGASLTASVSEPSEGQGSQANIAKVKVELPARLPSRLTTLQKACTNAQFVADPAGCPSESKIGYATVHTPLLPVPLTGPAIFVSHGGEAFPSLTMVLQGYGVTVDLVGTTFISKAGVTCNDVQDGPGCSLQHVRTDASGGQVLGTHGDRRPLQGGREAEDADRIRCAERRAPQRDHSDRRHGLPEGEEAGEEEGASEEEDASQGQAQAQAAVGVSKGKWPR